MEIGAETSFTPRITRQERTLSSANTAKAKGKAREQPPVLPFNYAGESWDLAPQEYRVFQDCDKREGEEHVHACFSPLKNGRRVDSQDLLTVNARGGAPLQQRQRHCGKSLSQAEDDASGEETGDRVSSRSRKKRAHTVTSDLPPELLQPANKWKCEIMPALFLWVAAQKDIWNIPVKELVDALTTICRTRI
ncbi:hypothetical protein Agabi119p4_7696 [Agaricus bisporus var. burnettii]|uniref:Uncharacterized protein n=1 Tax=Agaricus bisporus var. burnettii TaxID=192524 RepID=A0A8H7EZ60_AGABI|nr:hypothetical protein Agabi119p4_7696 [Agaricus bisporus var. burnettii]